MEKKALLGLCTCMIFIGSCAKKEETPTADELIDVVEADAIAGG